MFVHDPELAADRLRTAFAAVLEDVGAENDDPVGDAEARLVGAARRHVRADRPARRRVTARRDCEQNAVRVEIGDGREPAAAQRVVGDARVGQTIAAALEERGKLLRLERLGRRTVRSPRALGEIHHLDDEAGPRGDLHVGRLEAAGGDVVQSGQRLRRGRDGTAGRCDRTGENERRNGG